MDSFVRKKISVALTEEEMSFLEAMAKRDGVTLQKELRMIFYTELSALKDLYLEEYQQYGEIN